MNKLWLLLLLVIPYYQSIHAQEVKHAPTIAQCQADQRLWKSKLEQVHGSHDFRRLKDATLSHSTPPPVPSGVKDVSFTELVNWYTQMRKLLEPEYEVVGTVTDGRALLKAVGILKPDLVLVDVGMPLLNRLDAGREMRKLVPHVKLIFLTMNP